MKKLLSLTLILAILAASMLVGVVSASAETYDATVKVGDASYGFNIGESFTYKLSLKSSAPLSAGQIEIPVDFSVLSGDSEAVLNQNIATVAPNISATALVQRFDEANANGLKGYVINFATAGSYDFTASKTAVCLTFTIVKAGTVTLDPVLREFLNANMNALIDVSGNPVSGSVTAEVAVTESAYPVDQPVITGFTSLTNGLQFNWNACEGAVKYRAFKKVDGSWVMLGDTDAASFVDTDAVAGNQYTYTVRCLNASGAFASTYNKTGFTSYFLGTPAVTSVTAGKNNITVKWNAMNGAAKYRLFRKDSDKNTNFYKIADTTATSYVDPVVKSGVTYTYTVRCISADATAYTSPYLILSKSIRFIAQPAVKAVENAANGVKLTITGAAGAAKYRIFRKTGKAAWAKLADTTALTYTDKTAKSGTAYSYTVRCIAADGKSYTSTFDATGKTITYIAAAPVKSVANKVGCVTVTWAKSKGAVKTRVFRKLGSGKWTNIGDTTGTSLNDKKAVSGKTYSYAVRFIDKTGKTYTSALGAAKSIKYVAAPAVKSVAKAKTGVKVTWAKTAGAAKYRVLRKVGSGKWTKLVDAKSTSIVDTKVKKKTKYAYTVQCLDAKGKVISAYNTTGKAILYK